MKKFTVASFPSFSIHIYENHPEKNKESFNPWRVKITIHFLDTGHTLTEIEIKRRWTVFDETDFPLLPQGFLITNQALPLVVDRSEVCLTQIVKKKVPAGPNLVTTAVAKEIPISIPMMISKKRNLENIVGQNFLASLSAPEMSLSPIDPSNEYSLRVKVQLASSKPLEGYNRLTGGQVKVYVHVGVGEYEFHGIDKKKLSRKIFLPGVFLFENKRKEQNVKTEFFWESEVQGQFTAPDGMIGSKRFYDVSEDGEVIKGGFVYDIPGANWVSYLAAILGLQMLLWGGQIMRKHFGQMKNT